MSLPRVAAISSALEEQDSFSSQRTHKYIADLEREIAYVKASLLATPTL